LWKAKTNDVTCVKAAGYGRKPDCRFRGNDKDAVCATGPNQEARAARLLSAQTGTVLADIRTAMW